MFDRTLKKSIAIYIFMSISFIITMVNTARLQKIQGNHQQVKGYVNQSTSIKIPLSRCFEVQPQFDIYQKYLTFKPNSLNLQLLKSATLQPANQIKLLDNLRTPNSYVHKNILLFKDYVLIFMAPKTIIIVKQKQKEFEVSNTYELEQIDYNTQLKMYKFGQEAFTILLGKNKVLLLNQNGYTTYELNIDFTVSHFQEIPNKENQFFVAEYEKGFGRYKLNKTQKSIRLIHLYDKQFFHANRIYILDFSLLQFEKGIIYVLDGDSGVFKMYIDEKINQAQAERIISQPQCEALDNNKKQHFVLVCQIAGNKFTIQAFPEEKDGKKTYKKIQPSFHETFFNDIKVSGDYYMVFSSQGFDIYFIEQRHTLMKDSNVENQLSLPGLQTFNLISDSILYTVESGILKKYNIYQSPAQLLFKSQTTFNKQFAIKFYGPCPKKTQKQQSETCQQRQIISMEIMNQAPQKTHFSLSVSFIVMIIIVLMLIIWVCLKKYKGLQQQARRVLQVYKKKKPAQKFVF